MVAKKIILIVGVIVVIILASLLALSKVLEKESGQTEPSTASPTPIPTPTYAPIIIKQSFNRFPSKTEINSEPFVRLSGQIDRQGPIYIGKILDLTEDAPSEEEAQIVKDRSALFAIGRGNFRKSQFVLEVRDIYNESTATESLPVIFSQNNISATFSYELFLPKGTNSILIRTIQNQILDRVYVDCNLFSPC